MQSVFSAVASLATDWFIVGGLLMLIFFDVLRAGSGRVIALTLACLATYFVLDVFAQTRFIGSVALDGFAHVVFIVILFALSYILMRRLTVSYGDIGDSVLTSLFTAAAAVVCFLSFWILTPALSNIWQFGGFFQTLFSSSFSLFWILGSMFVMALSRS